MLRSIVLSYLYAQLSAIAGILRALPQITLIKSSGVVEKRADNKRIEIASPRE